MRSFLFTILSLSIVTTLLADDIITSREGTRALPLPRGDDVFHFVVYSDRTGGKPEGIKILEQAVEDTNLLDPDLVMTVGDLIQGICPPDQWMEQMREYRSVMEKLNMPWYPVAGNHDTYWSRRDENAPPQEFDNHFEEHFGPLWYAFRHKNAGFIALYTDEGVPEEGRKSYHDPEQAQMSAEQMGWLKETLAKLSDLDNIFVFLHHPRWIERRYPDNNWPEVHNLLAEAGNVRAVFAGHIHYLHHAGEMDGIEYLSLGATGSSTPGGIEDPEMGFLHHVTVVTVREGKTSTSVIPVGGVMDPRKFHAERQEDLHLLSSISKSLKPTLAVDAKGRGGGSEKLTLHNPSTRPIEVTLVPEFDAKSWFFSPDHVHTLIKPGDTGELVVDWVHLPGRPLDPVPTATVKIDYLAGGYRVTLPEREIEFKTEKSAETE